MSEKHELTTSGPLRYPGGKNGMFIVHCSCGYSTAPDSTEARAMKPAKAHKEAKEKNCSASVTYTPDFRYLAKQWLIGDWTHETREDLALLLDESGDAVTLTFEELYAIMMTVRANARQR